jgi:hypothetical protein
MDSQKNMNKKTIISIVAILVIALIAGWFINNKNQEAASVLSPSADRTKDSDTLYVADVTKVPPSSTRSETESIDPNISVVTQDVTQILSGNLNLNFKGTFSGNTNNYALTRYFGIRQVNSPFYTWVFSLPGTVTVSSGQFQMNVGNMAGGSYMYKACVQYTNSMVSYISCGVEKPLIISGTSCLFIPGYFTPPCLFQASNTVPTAIPAFNPLAK